ncbi:hypothetical protein ACPCSP_25555 [Streptomyces cinereoruber]|uniref:hypothetical protein n=1 Tax=Streptomyces cinereoruber TaxID=67260 RepID=UPI003C2DF415
MTAQPRQTYPVPDLGGQAHEALEALRLAQERIGRVMAAVTAVAVVDVLTDHHREAEFDAAHAELIEAADGSLHATGRYWTAAGEEKALAEAHGDRWVVHEMNEWVPYMDYDNEHVWKPLVEPLEDRNGQRVYRLDLRKAAALPLD